MSTKVANAAPAPAEVKKVKKPKSLKTKKDKVQKVQEVVAEVTKSVENDNEKSISKTSTENIDRLIEFFITKYSLKESVVKKDLKESKLIPRNSVYSGKKIKDKDAPKRAKSAYIYYTIDQRSKGAYKDLPVTEQSVKFGKDWEKIKEDKKASAPFVKLAEKDKERYRAEKDKYDVEHPPAAKKIAHEDDPEFVLNPGSKKMVRKDGKLGQEILKAQE